MPKLLNQLHTAADQLLDPASYPGQLLAAAQSLRETLAALAGWDEHSADAAIETGLAEGVAISPADAARCILDYQRTVCFLRGTLAAIEAAGARCDGRIDVLYAGCGPLAPLAVALCHRAPRARFWPVDIHTSAVDSVRRLVARAGYDDQFGEIVCADASEHHWPTAGQVGIVEVMQRALEKEPQIAVTANLAPQLLPGGTLVPKCVKLAVQLLDPAVEFNVGHDESPELAERIRIPIVPLLQLRADNAAELLAGCAVEFAFDEPPALAVMVSTQITVYDEIVLNDYDSGLTMPWLAHDLGRSGPGKRGVIRLVTGRSPRLESEYRAL